MTKKLTNENAYGADGCVCLTQERYFYPFSGMLT